AQLFIDVGNLGPQTQAMTGDYTRNAISEETAGSGFFSRKRWFGQWDYGFNLSWELDFWGRLRRAIEAGVATLDASVEDYDDVLVTLLGDVATNYVQMRTFQDQIKLTQANVELQRKTLQIAVARFKGGTASELDVDQAQSNLSQTLSNLPQL